MIFCWLLYTRWSLKEVRDGLKSKVMYWLVWLCLVWKTKQAICAWNRGENSQSAHENFLDSRRMLNILSFFLSIFRTMFRFGLKGFGGNFVLQKRRPKKGSQEELRNSCPMVQLLPNVCPVVAPRNPETEEKLPGNQLFRGNYRLL